MQGRVRPGVQMFLVLCAIVLPVTVMFARIFAEVFELPFQRRRGWGAVRDALHLPGRRAVAPATPQGQVAPCGHRVPICQAGLADSGCVADRSR
jgi:hypothetical protein